MTTATLELGGNFDPLLASRAPEVLYIPSHAILYVKPGALDA